MACSALLLASAHSTGSNMKPPFKPKKTLLHAWPDGQALSIWHLDRGCWTYCHTRDGNDNRVGPICPTKEALMIGTGDYLKEWGI